MDRETLRGRVQTVTGLIAPEAVGPTLMHEHILCDITPPALAALGDPGPETTLENVWGIAYGTVEHADNKRLTLLDVAAAEIGRMVEAGGKTVVDLTCGGLKPDPKGLAEISARTGAQIVMGCGHYVEEYQDPANATRNVDSFASEIVGQVLEDAWGTGIRAGIIGEIGCQSPWTDQEKRVMRGALIAQQETGAALNVHPGRDPDIPQQIAAFVTAHGGEPARTVISHIDRTIFDLDRLLRLADTGIVIEFDLFGWETSLYALSLNVDLPNDAMRLKLIRALIEHGHLERVLISHDICYRTRLSKFGGHGYGHIFSSIVPLMRRRDFSDEEIDTMLVRTPRRLLAFD